jgi:crotonobetainyl-CoA:carnitine CoA-transferase CaiB-like acyl-CoA transferase
MSAKPFSGVTIVDFTRMLAGPFASHQLALLGANVIKVESFGGDDIRNEFISKDLGKRGMSSIFSAVNVNKRSVRIDLKKPEGVEIVKRLVKKADIVLENFRPGVMESLGIGYEALSAINPRLIYCAISGFGQSGPERRTASFDGMIQATSGLMSITGHKDGGPMRAGFAACDIIAGGTGAFAMASALFQRTHTGKGQFVDVAMLDATVNYLTQQICEYTLAGVRHTQAGNLTVSRKPTGDRFKTGDGHLVLAALMGHQFSSLMRTIGRADALDDPRFVNWDSRIEHSAALREIIEGALATADSRTWEKRLRDADVPCARIWTIAEVVEHPQLSHRDVLQKVEGPDGPVTMVGSGFRLAHGGGEVKRMAPALGEDTDEVLAEAGYSTTDIEGLRTANVV